MAVVKVDTSDEDKFKPKGFKLLPKGQYTFELAKDCEVETASTGNKMVRVEGRCLAEDENKGILIWDNLTITQKADWKLIHFALACGTQTKAGIKEVGGVDVGLLTAGLVFEAEVDVEPPSEGTDGKKYREKNVITRYLFEPEDAS